MSGLENQMKFDMKLRGYSPKTIKFKINGFKPFLRHILIKRWVILYLRCVVCKTKLNTTLNK